MRRHASMMACRLPFSPLVIVAGAVFLTLAFNPFDADEQIVVIGRAPGLVNASQRRSRIDEMAHQTRLEYLMVQIHPPPNSR